MYFRQIAAAQALEELHCNNQTIKDDKSRQSISTQLHGCLHSGRKIGGSRQRLRCHRSHARHGPQTVLRFVSSTECLYDTHWLLTRKSCARAECSPMFHIATFKFRFDYTSSSRLVDRQEVADGFVSFASRLICFKLGSTAIAKAVTEPNNPLADCFLRQTAKRVCGC